MPLATEPWQSKVFTIVQTTGVKLYEANTRGLLSSQLLLDRKAISKFATNWFYSEALCAKGPSGVNVWITKLLSSFFHICQHKDVLKSCYSFHFHWILQTTDRKASPRGSKEGDPLMEALPAVSVSHSVCCHPNKCIGKPGLISLTSLKMITSSLCDVTRHLSNAEGTDS